MFTERELEIIKDSIKALPSPFTREEEVILEKIKNKNTINNEINELKSSLLTCMEAIRKNLVYAQAKDETVLYQAYKQAEKVLSQYEEKTNR